MKLIQFGSRFGFLQAGLVDINSLDTVLKKVSTANSAANAVFQLVSLLPLVSEKQVFAALEQACSAFDSKTAISNRLEFELLLRLAGRRQITEALKLLSPTEGGEQEVVLIGIGSGKKTLEKKAQNLGHALGLRPKNKLFETNFRKNKSLILKSYGVSEQSIRSFENWNEKDAVESLVIERIALVSLEE
jgi:tRNA threonylcarbamoyladenosine modification (KEOPS) complex Cgi121 subunit